MSPLDKFGKFIVNRLRDAAMDRCFWLQSARLREPVVQQLQEDLQNMTPQQKDMLTRCVMRVVDGALHEVLCGIQESHDVGQGIEVLVDGDNIAQLSGMLHGNILGPEGWIARFSKYPPCQDISQ